MQFNQNKSNCGFEFARFIISVIFDIYQLHCTFAYYSLFMSRIFFPSSRMQNIWMIQIKTHTKQDKNTSIIVINMAWTFFGIETFFSNQRITDWISIPKRERETERERVKRIYLFILHAILTSLSSIDFVFFSNQKSTKTQTFHPNEWNAKYYSMFRIQYRRTTLSTLSGQPLKWIKIWCISWHLWWRL